MIFQLPVNLEIENRNVQAILDLDTGFVGFTEEVDGKSVEYFYQEGPIEFRKAFFEKIKVIGDQKNLVNFKISRKNDTMKEIGKFFIIKKEKCR